MNRMNDYYEKEIEYPETIADKYASYFYPFMAEIEDRFGSEADDNKEYFDEKLYKS